MDDHQNLRTTPGPTGGAGPAGAARPARPARGGPAAPGAAPRAVRVASATMGAQGLVLAALVVATIAWEQLLVETWAAGDPAASAVVAQGGLDALADSPVAVPGFVPVAIVTFLTLVPLGAVLAAMLRHRAAWVRSWLSVTSMAGMVFAGLALRAGPPAVFGALAALAGLSCVVLLLALWHPTASRWLGRSPSYDAGRGGA
ncbi:hypothetical protein GCM10009737_11940 [Nocardioides lentus]|uniref:DUF2127 domain-containing protein n=2 Tax=Nocardioides lentus TaxID=338077 RepID=A0ABP5AHZ3_9ACTN